MKDITSTQVIIKKLVLIVCLTIVAFLGVQFFILSTVGTLGPKISNTRTDTEALRLDTEIKLAQIRDHQTQSQILLNVGSDLQMAKGDVERLELQDNPALVDANNSYAQTR